MKVRQLIEYLEQYDPEGEVLLAMQPSWPFEYSIRKVISREKVLDMMPRRQNYLDGSDDDIELPEGAHENDVFLTEGEQLRYGSKHCWEVW